MKKPGKTALYLRISKDSEGTGLGVQRQEEDCRRRAEAKGWEVDEPWVIVENDTSATRGRRPGFERLIAGMESGEVRAVVAYKVDRLVRGMKDMARLWEVVQEKHVLVVTVEGDLDLTTAAGRSMAALWSVIAQIEVENLRTRVTAKAQQNLKAGRNANGGTRPLGWEADRTTQIPAEAKIIRELTDRVIAGESLTSLVRDLNRRKVPTAGYSQRLANFQAGKRTEPPTWEPWNTRRLRETLSLPRHAGYVTYQGQIVKDEHGQPVPAKWDPILDRETFDRLQAALAGRRTVNENWTGERRHLLSGTMLRCSECGERITAFVQTTGRVSYRCRGHLSRDRDLTDAYVLREVRAYAEKYPVTVTAFEAPDRADLSEEIETLEQRLADLEDGFVSSGGDPARLARMTSALDAQLAALREERMTRLAWQTGVEWVVYADLDDLLATSGSLLPNDDPMKARRIEEQRQFIAMYAEKVVLSPSPVRGGKFDEDSIDIVWRKNLQWSAHWTGAPPDEAEHIDGEVSA